MELQTSSPRHSPSGSAAGVVRTEAHADQGVAEDVPLVHFQAGLVDEVRAGESAQMPADAGVVGLICPEGQLHDGRRPENVIPGAAIVEYVEFAIRAEIRIGAGLGQVGVLVAEPEVHGVLGTRLR